MRGRKLKGVFLGIVVATLNMSAIAEELMIEEVIVTATKRAESVQDVPVAISVVDARTIDAMRIDEYTDLTKISPSLTMNRGDWATNSGFSLRGIGTNVFSTNIDPSVSIIVDDVAVVRSAQAFSDLSDIHHVEVLRGPQSTLFGKSASAGVINITTNSPGDEFSARVRVSTTDDDETSINATIGGPLGDTVGFRLSAFDKDRSDGHIKNMNNGADVNGSESSGVRGKLVWDISDTLSTTLSIEHSESESSCCHRPYRDVPSGANFLGAVPRDAVLTSVTASEDNDRVAVDDPTWDDSSSDSMGLRFEADFGEYQFLSVTSYTEWDYEVATDVDGTDFDLLGLFTGGALSGGISQGGGFELEALSHEFRLVSPASDNFEYVVGLFYSDIQYDRDFARGPIFSADWVAETGTESLAMYAQGTWSISERTDITAGLRLNREEISHDFDNALSGLRFKGDDKENATPGKVSIQHYSSDDLMLFASFSVGYKGQGYDISSSFRQSTSDNPVGSEDSTSFEFGFKGTFLDGRLQLNPTIFFASYDDFQAQQARIVDGVIELGITNVGELETWGVEVDFQALISENLRLVGGFAYVDAEIKSFSGADCWTGQTNSLGCSTDAATGRNSQDLGGKDLNNSPDFKMTLSAEYFQPLTSMPFDGFFNLSYRYQSDVNFSLLADPGSEQDGYGVLNLSIGLVERENQRYEITLFANNVTDEEFVTGLGNVGGLWGGTPVYAQVVPRGAQTYSGIEVGFNF
ncbi:MAG: TonB-dependent receptor [Gammaproteobacteria bacterium]|nr:TonB-dependent receptor [Gammaproteobacteria bacterium]